MTLGSKNSSESRWRSILDDRLDEQGHVDAAAVGGGDVVEAELLPRIVLPLPGGPRMV
jgi:hypothetical protein